MKERLRGIWDGFPGWLRGCIQQLCGALVALLLAWQLQLQNTKAPGQEAVYWSQEELEKVIEKSVARGVDKGLRETEIKVGRMEAGLSAFIEIQSDKAKLAFLQAQQQYEDRERRRFQQREN